MGGLLRVPKVPAAAPAAPTPAPVAAPAAPLPDAGLERRRRGLSATIATSERGVADARLPAPNRKMLLGE